MHRRIREKGFHPNHLEVQTFRKLIVQGLDSQITDHLLREYFGQWGNVLDAYAIKNKKREVRGSGSVIYSHSTMVDEAMKVESHMISGKPVTVNHIRPPSERCNFSPHDDGTRKIYIKPVTNEMTKSVLVLHFQEYGTISNVTILKDNKGRRLGDATIEFEDFDDVNRVLAQKFYRINGTFVEVSKTREFTKGCLSYTDESSGVTNQLEDVKSECIEIDEDSNDDISIVEVLSSSEADLNATFHNPNDPQAENNNQPIAENSGGCRIEDLETVVGSIFQKIGADALWQRMRNGVKYRLRKYRNGVPAEKNTNKTKNKSKNKTTNESKNKTTIKNNKRNKRRRKNKKKNKRIL